MQESVKVKEDRLFETIVNTLFFCAVLTSSFDIFLTVDLFGFNLRITQFFQGLLICLAFWELFKTRILYLSKGFIFLVLFAVCNLLCTFHTIMPMWNIAYDIWLILFVMVVWAIFVLYRNNITRMVELYLLSFYVMTIWGCIQFALGVSGISDWMITQWWTDGIPRVNGFTYEPSYYSTYLLMGFLVVQTSCLFGICKIGKLPLRPLCYLSAIALVLSSSRMVYIPICCMFVFAIVVILFQIRHKKISIKDGAVELGKQGIALILLFIYFCIIQFMLNNQVVASKTPGGGQDSSQAAVAVSPAGSQDNNQAAVSVSPAGSQEHFIGEEVKPEKASNILLRNVGANGDFTNINWRLKGWKASWELFVTSPFYGYGLGGISAEAMRTKGMTIDEMKAVGRGELTGNVFLEVLAATGLIGTVLFLTYGWQLVAPSLLPQKGGKSKDFIQLALVVALIGECMILAMNQNILRNYVWLHVAVLSCYASKKNEKTAE